MFCGPKWGNSLFFLNAFTRYYIPPWKSMFHSRDSPRLLVCDTGFYLEQNHIGFITVAICGGYISKYPGLINSALTFVQRILWQPVDSGASNAGLCLFSRIQRIQGFKGFYSRKYNQLHTSGICGLFRLTSIYITYFVRIKPLVYTITFQWYVTRLPRVIFNQSQMTRFFMSEISLKYFERNLRAR